MSKPNVRTPSIAQIKESVDTGKIDVDVVIRPPSSGNGSSKVLKLISTQGVNQIKSGQVRCIIQALLLAKDQGFTATMDDLCGSFDGGDSLLDRAGLITDQPFTTIVNHYTDYTKAHLVGFIDLNGVPYKVNNAKRKAKVSATTLKQKAHNDMVSSMKL